jgi:aconitate hydratase
VPLQWASFLSVRKPVQVIYRIHKTNLKQGLLGLTFATESDYDKIEDDTINFIDLVDFAPGKPLTLEFVHTDGTTDSILANHTYNEVK